MNNIPLVIKTNSMDNNVPIVSSTLDVLKRYYSREVVHIYAIFYHKNCHLMFFPEIVISPSNPAIHRISKDLTNIYSSLGFVDTVSEIATDLFEFLTYDEEYPSDKIIKFKIGYSIESKSDSDRSYSAKFEHISEEAIISYSERSVTENTIYISLNRFDYNMELLSSLDNGYDIFRRNIKIFCSAFLKFYKDDKYENRKEDYIDPQTAWISFATKYSATEFDAKKAYDDSDKYSYSVLTIEEILRSESEELKTILDKYNKVVFEDKIKKVLTCDDAITDDDMQMLFAEMIRKDHFFFGTDIYRYEKPIVSVIQVNSLSSLVPTFLSSVKIVKDMLNMQPSKNDESDQQEKIKINGKYNRIRQKFSENQRNVLIKNACANYLHIPRLTNGASSDMIVFKDCCIQYSVIDNVPTLSQRKCYMEDRFTGCIPYESIFEFHKSQAGINAIADVNKTLKRMFRYDETVDFFKAWLGSLILREPQRCILFIVGKSGENAKSGLTNALLDALGQENPSISYAKSCNANMFYANGKGGTTCDPYWASMNDAMLGVLPESNSKYPYDSATYKEASGGDRKLAAAKFKDPIVIRHTAKYVVVSNDFPTFDNFDRALQSRAYPIICHGVFKADSRDVPETEEEQNEKGIFNADMNFWSTDRKKALLSIIFGEGFELYKKNGLRRSSWMEKDLTEWKSLASNYVKFSMELESRTHDGKGYRTPLEDIKNAFAIKFRKIDISNEEFELNMEKEADIKTVTIDGKKYYEFKHKNSLNSIIVDHENHTTLQFYQNESSYRSTPTGGEKSNEPNPFGFYINSDKTGVN